MIKENYEMQDADVTLYKSVFTDTESKTAFTNLIEKIIWQQDEIKLFGNIIKLPRLTAWYGDEYKSYKYSGIEMHPNAWNEDLLLIKDRIENISKINFNSCLLNYYRNGNDSVSWHQDNEKELGVNPAIGSVSFGATRIFQLKHISDVHLKKIDIPLTNGSYLLMDGTTQHYWKHQIPKTRKVEEPRINLTFRKII